MANFPIFGGFNDRPEIGFDSENLINLFMLEDPQGKKKNAFLGSPGLRKDLTLLSGSEQARQLYTYKSMMTGVVGQNVYKFTAPLIKNLIGEIGTSRGYVSISSNNAGELIYIDGNKGYLFNTTTNVFTEITAEGFPPKPLNVVNMDGFFVIPLGESSYFQINAQNQGLLWDATDAAVINSEGGDNVGVGLVNARLYFFKETVTEVWYNAGAADFPFRKDTNLVIDMGCFNAATIASGFGVMLWLARDRDGVASIRMATGQMPIKVSNESIANLIANFSNPADATAYIYSDVDHVFYVISWTTDDITLVYDVTTKIWAKWEVQSSLQVDSIPNSGKTRHLSSCHAYFNQSHYVGSYKAPILYSMSLRNFTNDGQEIRRLRTCQHFFQEGYVNMLINSLQIDMKMGLGTDGETYPLQPGINPRVYIRISRDGMPFGNYHEATTGRIGQYAARALFRKLGLTRNLVVEITFYDPVLPVAILGASINFEALAT